MGRGDSWPAGPKRATVTMSGTDARSDRRQLTIGCAIRRGRRPRLRSLAQAALELPTVGRGSDGNDVEIETLIPLVRVFVRNECDLAQDGPVGVVVALGGQHLQIFVVQLASRRCLALIGGLDDGDVGNGTASQAHQRAYPTDRLPHVTPPLLIMRSRWRGIYPRRQIRKLPTYRVGESCITRLRSRAPRPSQDLPRGRN